MKPGDELLVRHGRQIRANTSDGFNSRCRTISLPGRDHQHVGFVLRRVAARAREVFEAGDGGQLPSLIEGKFDDAVDVKRDRRHARVCRAGAAEGDVEPGRSWSRRARLRFTRIVGRLSAGLSASASRGGGSVARRRINVTAFDERPRPAVRHIGSHERDLTANAGRCRHALRRCEAEPHLQFPEARRDRPRCLPYS